ncbi:MAG: dihydroorotase [Planctomycetia bacterium]|nr:dihydroorotase [Planctomycetia bacterium]
MSQSILIKNGRVIDPSQQLDQVMNVLIENGHISAYNIQPSGREREIDATGKIVSPGLIDLHVHLREPGGEEDETIATGTSAAINGGYTSIACIPNTNPPIDSPADVEFLADQAIRADRCNVYVVGCISKNRAGEELSEMGHLARAGVVAFSDDGSSVANAELMRRAFEYAKMFDLPILSHCEDKNLTNLGVMHEGEVSVRLGLRGIPAAAEDIMTARDIMLAESTGGRLHVMHVSTARSVELIRQAKRSGLKITAEVTPHHLTLTDERLVSFDSNLKMSPPLRTRADVEACIAGLLDGTLDCVSTDHAPHALEKKQREIDHAPFGVTGLETALGVLNTCLVKTGKITWQKLIEKMSTNPAKIIHIPKGTLAIGADADVTIIDPEEKWRVTPEEFQSKSVNNAYLGWELTGRAVCVMVNGRVRLNRMR